MQISRNMFMDLIIMMSYFVKLFIIYLYVISTSSGYATNSQNRRINRSTTSKSASSRGEPNLHYTYEWLLDDKNGKTTFLYIGVSGVTILLEPT